MSIRKQEILAQVKSEIKKNATEEYKKSMMSFFTENVKAHGTKTPVVRKIARESWKDVKQYSKKEVFEMSESLMKEGYNEYMLLAFEWIFRKKKEYEKKDFVVFESWIKKYVSNWSTCDDFCTHSLVYLLVEHPELIQKVKKWTKSENRWMKRASAVVLCAHHKEFYKKGNSIEHAFEIAENLMQSEDDLVQKGYGWMLKVLADYDRKAVFDFMMKYKDTMPRTALRYAIEKMSQEMKNKIME